VLWKNCVLLRIPSRICAASEIPRFRKVIELNSRSEFLCLVREAVRIEGIRRASNRSPTCSKLNIRETGKSDYWSAAFTPRLSQVPAAVPIAVPVRLNNSTPPMSVQKAR
jgi:hypothetical protein